MHSKYHHRFFTNKHNLFFHQKDFFILFFSPRSCPRLFFLFFAPAVYFSLKFLVSENFALLAVFMSCTYFILYEIFHLVSHLPKSHPMARLPLFKQMWQHHLDHHNPKLMHKYNFNIVYPLCDILFRTQYKK